MSPVIPVRFEALRARQAAAFPRLRVASVRAEARAGGTHGPVRSGPDGPGNVVRSGTGPGCT